MTTQIADVTVIINNDPVGVIPNSVKFTEGKGEQKKRAVSYGGGTVRQVFSNNIESNISKVMMELPVTPEAIELARALKSNRDQNAIQISGTTPEGNFSRTFTNAALVNDYEVNPGADTNIPLEFETNAAI